MSNTPLIGLEQKLNPDHSALVLIDIQNDYCSEGGYVHRALKRVPDEIIAPLKVFLAEVRKTKVPVIFVNMVRDEQTNSAPFKEVMIRHGRKEYPCPRGSWGAKLVDGIEVQKGEFVVEKNEKSAFMNTNFEIVLKNLGVKTIALCGSATNICLGSTAFDGFQLGYYIIVLRDLSRGTSEDLNKASLSTIEWSCGQVVSSEEVLKIWQRRQ